MTARPHDALFKAAFEHPEHAGALLRSILSPALCDAIDWPTLAHEPGSFIDRQLDDGHTDLLFSAKLTTVQPDIDTAYMYLLFEHRSTPERQLPRRLLRYIDGVWERHDQQHGGQLPLVLPILVCHAPGGWTAPTAMQDLFAPHPSSIPDLAQHVPHFRVIVEDLAHLSNEQLKLRALATVQKLALWLLRDARDADALKENFDAWRESFSEALLAPHGMQAVGQLLRYIFWVSTDLQFQQFREMIHEGLTETEVTAMTIAEELIQQGRAEGRMEGRMEGRAEALMRLLVQRFGSVPERYRERFAAVTDEQFDRFCRRMFEVSTLEAVFDD